MDFYLCFIILIKQFFLLFFLKSIFYMKGYKIPFEKKLYRFIKENKKERKNNEIQNIMSSITEYINLIFNNTLKKIHYRRIINKPKISIISSVFNKDKYLNHLIKSIQNQNIEEFELIFIDDCSTDQSVNIINQFSKIDSRIKLIKNKINKGTLYSRSNGALHSKGEYLIFVDSDDLVLKEGLLNSYNYIKKNNLSIVQFNTIFKRNETLSLCIRAFKYKNIIRQPILSYVFYYNEYTRKGDEQNTALWDKVINRHTVLKSINFIGNYYINENIKKENDVILLFSIFQCADSYQYINETGYFYDRTHNDSITYTWTEKNMANQILYSIFKNIKFLFLKTRNTYLDKLYSIYKLHQSFERYKICFQYAKSELKFIKEVLLLFLKSPYILFQDKKIIYSFYYKNLFYEKGIN